MSLSLNSYGGTVGVTFLLSQFITYAAAVAEPQETYIQQNGSLDGYVEDYSSSESLETATESVTETKADVGETSSMAAEAETVTGTDTTEWAANTSETGISATESPTTTEWWTPESEMVSATTDAKTTTDATTTTDSKTTTDVKMSTDADSHTGEEISTSTTEWWTPESEVASATANTDTTTDATFQGENETSTSQTSAKYSEWTPTSITAASATGTASETCGTAWAQCGGEGFTGADCCADGLTCVTADSYWAKCVSASTLVSLSSTGGNSSTSEFQTTSVSTIYGESVYSTQVTVHTTDSAGSTIDSIINSNYVSSYEKGVSSIATYVNSTNSGNLGHNILLRETQENGWKVKAMIAGLVGLSVVMGGL